VEGLGANWSQQIAFAVQTLLVESALPTRASEEDRRNSGLGREASATEASAPKIVPSRDRLPQCYRTVSVPPVSEEAQEDSIGYDQIEWLGPRKSENMLIVNDALNAPAVASQYIR